MVSIYDTIKKAIKVGYSARLDFIFCLIGGMVLTLYWWKVGGASLPLGADGDGCFDFLRQEVAEQLSRHKWVSFYSHSFMAPVGLWIPFASWVIERDLLGGLIWWWKPGLPIVGVYYWLSLMVSFIGVGFILRKALLAPVTAWGLATFFILFQPARHLKTWYHFEFLIQHWLYLGFFLDVLIWKRQ